MKNRTNERWMPMEASFAYFLHHLSCWLYKYIKNWLILRTSVFQFLPELPCELKVIRESGREHKEHVQGDWGKYILVNFIHLETRLKPGIQTTALRKADFYPWSPTFGYESCIETLHFPAGAENNVREGNSKHQFSSAVSATLCYSPTLSLPLIFLSPEKVKIGMIFKNVGVNLLFKKFPLKWLKRQRVIFCLTRQDACTVPL